MNFTDSGKSYMDYQISHSSLTQFYFSKYIPPINYNTYQYLTIHLHLYTVEYFLTKPEKYSTDG